MILRRQEQVSKIPIEGNPFQLPPPVQPGKITRSLGPYCAYGHRHRTALEREQAFAILLVLGRTVAISSGENVLRAIAGGA